MKYLAAFASSASLTGFRLTEFTSVAASLHIPIRIIVEDASWLGNENFCVFESDASEKDIHALISRCILLRGVYILLQGAPDLESLLQWRRVGSSEKVLLGEDESKYLDGDYFYQVETIGKKYSGDAKKEIIDDLLSTVSHSGVANWAEPSRRFVVFLEHQVEVAPPGTKDWHPNGPLLRAFHALHFADSQRCAMLSKYDLKKRPYIGTTSMPPEESILMSNLAGVLPGHFVYDPFCGTGSLLVAAAHCGAHTIGSDADGRVMRHGTVKGAASPQMRQQRQLAFAAYSEDHLARLTSAERELPSLTTNFVLYGLPPPECLRLNFSTWEQSWRVGQAAGTFLDAIVSDPPYGLREPRKKVNQTDGGEVLSLSAYNTHEVVLDLVLFAARRLAVGGHLAFWHPTTDAYTDEELPRHPSFEMIYNIPQRLSLKVIRRLVVFKKVRPEPHPPPSREQCSPQRNTDDLRKLMDETKLPDNEDYTHYRARVQRRKEASQRYRELQPQHAQKSSRPSFSQEEIVANREKNIRVRNEKQEASHEANLRSRQDK